MLVTISQYSHTFTRSSIENLATVAIALSSCAQVGRLNRLNALSS